MLSQKGNDREIRVIAYASHSLRPSKRSMWDYSSAKIELMALKWSVCEKFKDYLLGSKFTVFTDNNLLVYVKTSKLGAAQIQWLSELALYDFNIVYQTGRSNLVADGGQKARGEFVTKPVATMRMRNGKPFLMLPYVKS